MSHQAYRFRDSALALSCGLEYAKATVALAGELGLSPAARDRLKGDPDRGPTADVARIIHELDAKDRERRQATVDAQFDVQAHPSATGGPCVPEPSQGHGEAVDEVAPTFDADPYDDTEEGEPDASADPV